MSIKKAEEKKENPSENRKDRILHTVYKSENRDISVKKAEEKKKANLSENRKDQIIDTVDTSEKNDNSVKESRR